MLIEAYKTSDGMLFESEHKAREHQENILGEALDELVPQDDRGNGTRADKFNILMKMIKDPELLKKVEAVYNALKHMKEE